MVYAVLESAKFPPYTFHTWPSHIMYHLSLAHGVLASIYLARLPILDRVHGCDVLGCEVSIYLPRSFRNIWICPFLTNFGLSRFSRDRRPCPVSDCSLACCYPCFHNTRYSYVFHFMLARHALFDCEGTRSSMYDRECVGLPRVIPHLVIFKHAR